MGCEVCLSSEFILSGEKRVPGRADAVRHVLGKVGQQHEVLCLPRNRRRLRRLHEGEDGHGQAAFRLPLPRQGPPDRQVGSFAQTVGWLFQMTIINSTIFCANIMYLQSGLGLT